MFQNREDAARQLAARLRDRPLRRPLVLAIPRGGVVQGAVVARALDADLDVVLARKLRAPSNPELALGAVAESGQVYLNWDVMSPGQRAHVDREIEEQLREIARRRRLFRGNRRAKPVRSRSVIVIDDGIATGATMIAALRTVRGQHPHEIIVAVPVADPDRIKQIQPLCTDIICLRVAPDLCAVGQFYEDFTQVEDAEAVALLQPFFKAPVRKATAKS